MEQFKRTQIIILPAENNTNIVKILKNDLHYTTSKNISGGIYQNLYIVNDDKIQEGDWCYHTNQKSIIQIGSEAELMKKHLYLKKIIATTDTSLRIYYPCVQCDGTGQTTFSGTYTTQKKCDLCSQFKYPNTKALPRPSQQFIEKYIESYNKGSQIIDVLVEYESIKIKVGQYAYLYDVQLKINSDNTINIQSAKESWTRDEIDFKLNKLLNELLISKRNLFLINNPDSNKICSFLNKWAKENL